MTYTQEAGRRPSIKELCAGWKAAATRGGGISIGAESEAYRLRANGIAFHDLEYAELREAAVGLADILLLPGLNTIVDLDHELMWSWCGELLLGGFDAPFASSVDREIRELATTTVRGALANVRPPTTTREAFEKAREASRLIEPNARQYLSRAGDTLPYLAFPLLEAVARRACADYVDLDGRVKTAFPKKGGEYKIGERCNNVADLLRLLVETVGSPPLKEDLRAVLSRIGELGSGEDGRQSDGNAVISNWRNSSLHGETSLSTIGGTVLTVALLIALDSIEDDYSRHRAAALARARREVDRSEFSGVWDPSPWNFYPPFHVPARRHDAGPTPSSAS